MTEGFLLIPELAPFPGGFTIVGCAEFLGEFYYYNLAATPTSLMGVLFFPFAILFIPWGFLCSYTQLNFITK
jgi:hypothetical protein